MDLQGCNKYILSPYPLREGGGREKFLIELNGEDNTHRFESIYPWIRTLTGLVKNGFGWRSLGLLLATPAKEHNKTDEPSIHNYAESESESEAESELESQSES